MSLDEFLQDDDPNKWWRLSQGEMQNLFDGAMERICERDAEIDKLKYRLKCIVNCVSE